MFKGNLKITLRNFARNKGYSIINILGLSIGIACVIIIFSWVQYELSFDKYHLYSDRIYTVQKPPFSTLAPSFVPLLKQDFPEIEEIARLTEGGELLVKYDEKSFVEKRLFFAEENIFNILSMEMLAGDTKTCLSQPNSIVLTESMVHKYFGTNDPLGKIIMLADTLPFSITGVIKDMPANSHFHCDFLASYLTLKSLFYEYFYGSHNFSDNVCLTYMRLAKDTDPLLLEGKLPKFIDRYLDPHKDEGGKFHLASESNQIKLVKVTDIHLHSHTFNDIESNGDIKYVRIFFLIALFILLIACINFINLSIAKGLRRAKEVALKKALGSGQSKIILELITDSLFYTIIALFLAIVMYETIIPYFSNFWNGWTGLRLFSNPSNLLFIAGILIFINLVAGLYPAIYISQFQPIQILKNSLVTISRHSSKTERSLVRKSLVVIQFSISIAVIIGIGVINKQIRFMQNSDLGYDKENIITFSADDILLNKWHDFKQRLLSNTGIKLVTISKRAPTDRLLDDPGYEIEVNGNLVNHSFPMPHNRVEHDFFRTYGIKIIAGRDFDRNIQTDATEAAILNETAVKQLNFKNPSEAVGVRIRLEGSYKTIIGVCGDFHYESLHRKISAIVTYISADEPNTVAVRLAPGNIAGGIKFIGKIWDEYHKDTPLEYTFLDERINRQYLNEQRMLKLFDWFGLLGILIACMGLFGLTAYSTERRNKEIGIRKANGATTLEIMLMLSVDFTKWVLIAFVLVCPASYYFMHLWLQNFAYKTQIGWLVFAASGIAVLLIALFTVSWQSWLAAKRNPVDALRYE
ncbi:MAG: ABC transporter permease [Bacteroidales bacterium]|nr:ABC transporter permease [Bacteroidales bacterium]